MSASDWKHFGLDLKNDENPSRGVRTRTAFQNGGPGDERETARRLIQERKDGDISRHRALTKGQALT